MFPFGPIAFLLLVLANHVTTDDALDQCYCLKTEVSGLRGALHMEPVMVDGEHVYLIAEQVGLIHKFNPNAADGQKLTTYINITDLVEVDPAQVFELDGLLGFAAHPDYAVNRMLYLYSVRKVNDKTYLVISEIMGTSVNGEKILLLIERPGDGRNGGQLLFGLDGYLYAFIGDGQNETSTSMAAQDGADLLGKAIRLDVAKLTVADYKLQYYSIPEDNPQHQGWRPEVYARGFRNPWRCSVDTEDSRERIFCGDLGSSKMDEISILENGGNYGYPLKEGTTCIGNATLCAALDDEVLPVYSFNRSAGPISAVIGGPVYRGTQFTSLQRHLVIGDYISGELHSLEEIVAADSSSQWKLHSFTECEVARCGCNYKSTRRQHLVSIATSFSDELMLLMTDSTKPGDPDSAILSLFNEDDTTKTCGGHGLASSSVLGVLMVLVSILNHWMKD